MLDPAPELPPTLIAPTEANLDGALASLARSTADLRMLRNYGLERVDPAAYTNLLTAVRVLSVTAVAALASAGRCPPPPASPR